MSQMKVEATMETKVTPEQNAQAAAAKVSLQPEPLELPKGALIAFRQSGGAPARPREIVIYPDGRVSFGGPDLGKEMYAHVPRKMNDAQIARARKTLARANFFRLDSATGEPAPDARVYEIVARAGKRVHALSVFDGAIPDALQPLVQQLSALIPKE